MTPEGDRARWGRTNIAFQMSDEPLIWRPADSAVPAYLVRASLGTLGHRTTVSGVRPLLRAVHVGHGLAAHGRRVGSILGDKLLEMACP